MEQGGKKATRTGKRLEAFIENLLIDCNYTYIKKKDFKKTTFLDQIIYTKQLEVCESIYGSAMKSDFVLYHPEKWPQCLIIESKWQQIGGSVDEKFPYLVANINERYPSPAMIVIDGGGFKKGAVDWLANQRGENLLEVLTMQQFQKWVNEGNI